MSTPNRHELSDEQWAKIEPHLPPEKRKGAGRPSHSHRQLLNAILWILRTGAPWRDLPERYGKWTTAYSRFRRWQKSGLWDQLFAALKADADSAQAFDWTVHHVDGSNIRAHQHAAGARRTPQAEQASAAVLQKRGPISKGPISKP